MGFRANPRKYFNRSLALCQIDFCSSGYGNHWIGGNETSSGDNLRQNLSSEERVSLINKYYEPHHKELNNAVGNLLMRYGACLIIDCHSFPSASLPCELDQSPNRPDICIGTDEFHIPNWLRDLAILLFYEQGFQIARNRPFSGTIVPKPHYHVNPAIYSVMIEINRSLYMSEETGIKNPQFDQFRDTLQNILQSLIGQIQNKIYGKEYPR